MSNFSLKRIYKMALLIAGACLLLASKLAYADYAILVDAAVMVETNPEPEPLEVGEEPVDPAEIGSATDASYVSIGGWAVTGAEYIDAATFIFDFVDSGSVTQATLTLPLEQVFDQNGSAPIEISFFSDNGVIEYTDYSIGFVTPIAELEAVGLSSIEVDVTGPVNSALRSGRYVGFRVKSSVAPGSVDITDSTPYTGVKIREYSATLQFTPGAPPTLANDTSQFDGFTLVVPTIEAPGIGEGLAQLQLIDPNNLTFQLSYAEVTSTEVSEPPRSGIELLDCPAFSVPQSVGIAESIATYSSISGVLDIPSVNLNNEQVAMRLEYIEGTEPWLFETLSIGSVQSGPSDALISALGGGILVEPSQDFVPLCHGWALIGDIIRNRVVERNLITGETGATYQFNTAPDQFTLDDANNLVYMTVHPESERLYKLDLVSGEITYNPVAQTLSGTGTSYTYGWALRDITLGEGGNIFALMNDGELFDPEDSIPFSESGLWMGLMDGNANFLFDSVPLEEPVRVEYDPVLDHIFLATASNLATFTFDAGANTFAFVEGTDIPVGNACTDFDVSPDGTRLAYTCPNGNYPESERSIADMDPLNYYNNDGEWFLGSEPVSATFSDDGTLLYATDNDRLYIFDVVTHLILEDFELGLLEEESIKKIRPSRDGQLLYLFLNNDNHADNSKFYWMPIPDITGTPL